MFQPIRVFGLTAPKSRATTGKTKSYFVIKTIEKTQLKLKFQNICQRDFQTWTVLAIWNTPFNFSHQSKHLDDNVDRK